uniref:Uncharacterized protein n=1 Tax=Tanacetum cinerariifolium TaxID=118510 RepID=A0A6L2JG97_TANCI|nr:hypothetical protein [Tanacetum cinerariifolium]
MPYPSFIKVIIQYFILKHKSISKRNELFMNSIKHDGVLGRLKFVGKLEDNQVYGMLILDVIVNEDIKNSKAYKIYLALSTRAEIPKNARKGTKEPATPKKITKPQKLKGIETLSEAAQFAADTQKAIKASKKAHILQQKTEDSSEGVGITLEVPDEPKGRTKSLIERAVISPEQAGTDQTTKDDQARAQFSKIQKEKPEVLPTSFSVSLSSNYVSGFFNLRIESTVRNVLQKTLDFPAQSFFTPAQPASTAAKSLFELELKKILFDKSDKSRSCMTHDKHQEPRDKKKRKGKNTEPHQKSSTSKEPSKGKTQSKPSSTDNPVNAEEPLIEAKMDVEELILDDVANEAD